MLADFWQKVFAGNLGLQLAINSQNNVSLASYSNSLKAMQQVINVLYPSNVSAAPLQGELLVAVTGRILLQLAERLDGLSLFHDFAKTWRKNATTIDTAGGLCM